MHGSPWIVPSSLKMALGDGGLGELWVERVLLGERARALRELAPPRLREVSGERLADHPADLAEVVHLEAARGERRCPNPQSRRHGRRARVERHRVAVYGDADLLKPVLRL